MLYEDYLLASELNNWTLETSIQWESIDRELARTQPEILQALHDAAIIEGYLPVYVPRLMQMLGDDLVLGDGRVRRAGHGLVIVWIECFTNHVHSFQLEATQNALQLLVDQLDTLIEVFVDLGAIGHINCPFKVVENW